MVSEEGVMTIRKITVQLMCSDSVSDASIVLGVSHSCRARERSTRLFRLSRSSFQPLIPFSGNLLYVQKFGYHTTMSDRPLQVFVGPTLFDSVRSNENTILPRYNQRDCTYPGHSANVTTLPPRSRRARPSEDPTSFQQQDSRPRCHGHFIYLCMGGPIYCRLVELDAKEFENDDAFMKHLYRRCRAQWSQLWLLLTMSAADQVHLKQFHFMTNGPVVRCSRTSSLPPTAHEQYRHQGPDVECREDMLVHDLQRYSKHLWPGSRGDAVFDRMSSGQERVILDAIPKKVPYGLEYLKGHEGWGLHISLRLCYYRLAICMAGWAALSAVSVALLLDQNTGTLQDAVVPAGLSLTLFLFYVGLVAGLRK